MIRNQNRILAFLGQGTRFDGKLHYDGTVRLDGEFHGEIVSGGHLIVGESAVIQADIKIGTILINGEVRGSIQATQVIEITSGGRVIGNIRAPSILIRAGAIIQGHCYTDRDQSSLAEGEDGSSADNPAGLKTIPFHPKTTLRS